MQGLTGWFGPFLDGREATTSRGALTRNLTRYILPIVFVIIFRLCYLVRNNLGGKLARRQLLRTCSCVLRVWVVWHLDCPYRRFDRFRGTPGFAQFKLGRRHDRRVLCKPCLSLIMLDSLVPHYSLIGVPRSAGKGSVCIVARMSFPAETVAKGTVRLIPFGLQLD